MLYGLGALQVALLLVAAGAPSTVGTILLALAGLALVAVLLCQTQAGLSGTDKSSSQFVGEVEQLAPIAVLFFDPATATMSWSEGMYRLLGRAPGKGPASVRACLQAVHPGDRPRLVEALRKVGEGTPATDLTLRLFRTDGAERMVRLRLAAALDADGVPIRLMVLCLDLTEPLEDITALVDILSEADGVNRYKDALLSSFSHEIRTPLTGILGFTEILLDEVDGMHQEFIQSIQRNGYRLLDMLTQVLDLARVEGRMMPVEPREVDLEAQVRARVTALLPRAEEKGLSVRVLARHPHVEAVVDPDHLHRVLTHLLGNAIKFTDKGGVIVEVDQDADRAFVRVHDTGIGIDPAFLPHIFQAFRQESSGLDRNYEGTGLGLALAHKLVELMDGTISLESEKGKGTTFTIALPRARAVARRIPDPRTPEARTSLKLVSGLLFPEGPDPGGRTAAAELHPAPDGHTARAARQVVGA